MPGELGNEEESQQVGYYEHRNPQSGEWNDHSYGNVLSWKDNISPIALEIIRKRLEQNAKSK